MTTRSDIVVTHNPVINQSDLEDIQVALSRISPRVTLKEERPAPQGNAEWFFPAAVAVFIASGFLNGFLEEFGADSYHSLKNGLKKILKIAKEKPILWYQASVPPPDKSEQPTVSPSLSITLEIEHVDDDKHKISFIFPNDVDLDAAEKNIDILHKTILAAIEKDKNTPPEIVFGYPVYQRSTNYAFEPESSEWRELTPDYLYQRHLDKINKGKAKRKTKSTINKGKKKTKSKKKD